MGLKIKPSSFLQGFRNRIYNWNNFKAALRLELIQIEWAQIADILIDQEKQVYYIHFKSTEGETHLPFRLEEVQNSEEFLDYLKNNPQKIVPDRITFLKGHFTSQLKPYFLHSVTTKYILGLLAAMFVYLQLRSTGSYFIQRYDFLVKSSCNVECAEKIWSITIFWGFTFLTVVSPIIPLLFYKRIYRSALRSRKVSVINGTLTEMWLLGFIGFLLIAITTPVMTKATMKYSKVISSYSDGTFGTPENKLLRKIEMSSTAEDPTK